MIVTTCHQKTLSPLALRRAFAPATEGGRKNVIPAGSGNLLHPTQKNIVIPAQAGIYCFNYFIYPCKFKNYEHRPPKKHRHSRRFRESIAPPTH